MTRIHLKRAKVALSVAVATIVTALVIHEPLICTGQSLPPGVVEPAFTGDLLLAPDGSTWVMTVSEVREDPAVFLESFAPGTIWRVISGSKAKAFVIKADGSLRANACTRI